ncbi:MAG: crossover junction endodeoxyribonuclease RuvC [Thermodesulfobacteriota bacterium]
MSLVLGIDPGSQYTGYGLVARQGAGLKMVAAGRIAAKAGAPLPERLRQVFEGLTDILDRHGPDCVAVEDVFVAKNVRSAAVLGHVRGVVLLAAALSGRSVFEYSPAEVKVAVVGYGRAEKSQVGLMVKKILKARENLTEDAADALAVAICHANQNQALKGARR